MEQKIKEIFDLERIRDFVEAHIGQTGYVEEDCGERRKVLVVDTLIDGGHGAYIPGMVLVLFGRVDQYDMADLYDPEASEVLYDTLTCLEDEVNDCLNELLPSKGRYYIGYHEYDGSYCLFYEEEE